LTRWARTAATLDQFASWHDRAQTLRWPGQPRCARGRGEPRLHRTPSRAQGRGLVGV